MPVDLNQDLYSDIQYPGEDPYRSKPYKLMLGPPKIDTTSIYFASVSLTYSAKNMSSDPDDPLYQNDFYNRLWCVCYLIYHHRVLNKWVTFRRQNSYEDELISGLVSSAYLRFIKVDIHQDVLVWTPYLTRAFMSAFWWWFNNIYERSPSLLATEFFDDNFDDSHVPVISSVRTPHESYDLYEMAKEFYSSLKSLNIHPQIDLNDELIQYTLECAKSFDFDTVQPPDICDPEYLIMSRIHADRLSKTYRDVLAYV